MICHSTTTTTTKHVSALENFFFNFHLTTNFIASRKLRFRVRAREFVWHACNVMNMERAVQISLINTHPAFNSCDTLTRCSFLLILHLLDAESHFFFRRQLLLLSPQNAIKTFQISFSSYKLKFDTICLSKFS